MPLRRPALAVLLLALVLAGAPAAAEDEAGTIRLAQAGDPAVAILQSRILELEEELRSLTGRLERLEFEQRRLSDRLETVAPGEPAEESAVPGEGEVTPEASAPRLAPGQGVLGTIRGDPDTAALSEPPASALEGGESERFDAALELLQDGEWVAAEAAFERFIEDFPASEEAPVAAYWIGESRFFRGDLQAAAAAFASNYRTYGEDAPRAADNLLKLGMALAELGDTETACQTFRELESRYPDMSAPLRRAASREIAASGCA